MIGLMERVSSQGQSIDRRLSGRLAQADHGEMLPRVRVLFLRWAWTREGQANHASPASSTGLAGLILETPYRISVREIEARHSAKVGAALW